MAGTRDRALEAAVRLVGEQGVRALTHARVDAEAALPRGSTSNWFRTRDALVEGVVVWIAEEERADLAKVMSSATTAEELVDALCRVLEDATGPHATRTRARYALFFETPPQSTPPPQVRAQRGRFEERMRELLEGLGANDPDEGARTLLALCAGLIVNRLTVAPDTPLRPSIALAVAGIMEK